MKDWSITDPNLRLNALRLGVRLIAAAANPWSGLTRQAAHRAIWQPLHPFGWPTWWPFAPGKGDHATLGQILLMRSVLPGAFPIQVRVEPPNAIQDGQAGSRPQADEDDDPSKITMSDGTEITLNGL